MRGRAPHPREQARFNFRARQRRQRMHANTSESAARKTFSLDTKRRRDGEHAPARARARNNHAACECARAGGGGGFRAVAFEPEHQPAPAHFFHARRARCARAQPRERARAQLARARDEPFFFEHRQRRKRRGARRRVTEKSLRVQRFGVRRLRGPRVHNFRAPDDGGERHARREPFAHAQQIRRHGFVFAREPAPAATAPAVDFVGNQEPAFGVATLAQRAQKTARRGRHAAAPEHRLHHHRTDGRARVFCGAG